MNSNTLAQNVLFNNSLRHLCTALPSEMSGSLQWSNCSANQNYHSHSHRLARHIWNFGRTSIVLFTATRSSTLKSLFPLWNKFYVTLAVRYSAQNHNILKEQKPYIGLLVQRSFRSQRSSGRTTSSPGQMFWDKSILDFPPYSDWQPNDPDLYTLH